jgi:threonine dehydrogenase-like Zn-dependent dehydrogenase
LVDKNGSIRVDDLAMADPGPREVVISNRCSLISSGTELSVIKRFRTAGSPEGKEFPLGYSSSGVVASTGERCGRIQAGARVASQGWAVSIHADTICVPEPLVAEMPAAVSHEEAAFTTLTTVAMNAVRRAAPTLGDWALVIGQGLVGQIIGQLAGLAGARVIVADLYDPRLRMAQKTGAELAVNPRKDDLLEFVMKSTGGLGADIVFLCTGGENTEPFRNATLAAADRGRIVLVGRTDNLCTDDRVLYAKELSILAARGYGPGYHDDSYEKEGVDYPVGYVRWTENRNMHEALRLMTAGALDVKTLISHRLPQKDAPKAYATIERSPEEVMGVLLTYGSGQG